jgi:hypothetical protein
MLTIWSTFGLSWACIQLKSSPSRTPSSDLHLCLLLSPPCPFDRAHPVVVLSCEAACLHQLHLLRDHLILRDHGCLVACIALCFPHHRLLLLTGPGYRFAYSRQLCGLWVLRCQANLQRRLRRLWQSPQSHLRLKTACDQFASPRASCFSIVVVGSIIISMPSRISCSCCI